MFNLSGLSTSKADSQHVKVLVLGAGPARLSAALYAARADLKPVALRPGSAKLEVTICFS